MNFSDLKYPIIQAPMAGGPSTPELAAAVNGAGGFGFLAAGYKSPETVKADIENLRSLSDRTFGLNIFAPPSDSSSESALAAYADRLSVEAARYGVEIGTPLMDDDAFDAKVELAASERIAVVSFTFGCPNPSVVERLKAHGCDVWVTVTALHEAEQAAAGGADALVVQGFEAGGHRGFFDNSCDHEDFGLLALLRIVASQVDIPLVATGGIGDGPAIAAVLCAGARAAQLGTAFMLAPEAGTAPVHRRAIAAAGKTELTRAFSGRLARGITNRFMREHGEYAPSAYPQVHHMTTPIRRAAREASDPEAINLWAGQTHMLAATMSAGELVRRLGEGAVSTIERARAEFL